ITEFNKKHAPPIRKGRNYEYRKCLSCCNCWDASPKSTNICPGCGGKASSYISEFIPDNK
ncbi:MAG: hypothetical protein AABY22_32515, partial [Nanoarchaeota archaeon]